MLKKSISLALLAAILAGTSTAPAFAGGFRDKLEKRLKDRGIDIGSKLDKVRNRLGR